MLIFAFGTIWFWLLLAIAVILMTVFVENEDQSGTGATITLLVFLGFVCFLGNLNTFKGILTYASNNPGVIIGSFLGYVVIGVVWSFIKWYFHLTNIREKAIRKGQSKSWISSNIDVSSNKSRIIVWMSYWPLSGIWTLINDPMRKLFQWIQMQLSGFYQKMSDNMFKNFETKKEE